MSWEEDQKWEADWWGNCFNTFSEETKQISYAYRMGLVNEPRDGHWPVYDMRGKSVVDLGGGPASLLLKTLNVKHPTVVDPCAYPPWIGTRYAAAGIDYVPVPAEEYDPAGWFDECWIYNVLQHVKNPEEVIRTARDIADYIRIFEWIDIPTSIGHPHTLHRTDLNKWLGDQGSIETMQGENDCYGTAYFGYFETARPSVC